MNTLKILLVARNCLMKASKEKNKKHRNSLMFQFCKQMQEFCNVMAKENPKQKEGFITMGKDFNNFSKIYKEISE